MREPILKNYLTNKYRLTKNRDHLFFVPKDRNDIGHNGSPGARYNISNDGRELSEILDIIEEYGVDVSEVRENK